MGEFIYCLTRPGSEPLLKQEVKEFHPAWNFAFSRPGLVTFKGVRTVADLAQVPYLRFARRRGITEGRGTLAEALVAARGVTGSLQVYSRSAWDWQEGEPGEGTASDFADRAAELLALARPAGAQGVIHDFIEVDSGKWIWGRCDPGEMEFRGVAGLSNVAFPVEAPSRAYLKLEEALRAYDVRVEAEDQALDLGAAPGGMTWAWMQRGARVVGVDRGEMSGRIQGNSRFRWIESNLASLTPADIPQRLDWVSLDIHAQPSVALREALPVIEERHLLGFFMNLKIGRPGIVKDLLLMEREIAERLRLVRYCVKQLPANRDELAFFGVTPGGLKRGKFPLGPSPVMGSRIRTSAR